MKNCKFKYQRMSKLELSCAVYVAINLDTLFTKKTLPNLMKHIIRMDKRMLSNCALAGTGATFVNSEQREAN